VRLHPARPAGETASIMSDIKVQLPFLADASPETYGPTGLTPHCRPPSHAVTGSLHWICKPGHAPIVAEWVSGFWVALGRVDQGVPLTLSSPRWRYLRSASPAPIQ